MVKKHDLTVKKTYFIMKTGEFTMEIVGVIGIFHWDMAFFSPRDDLCKKIWESSLIFTVKNEGSMINTWSVSCFSW